MTYSQLLRCSSNLGCCCKLHGTTKHIVRLMYSGISFALVPFFTGDIDIMISNCDCMLSFSARAISWRHYLCWPPQKILVLQILHAITREAVAHFLIPDARFYAWTSLDLTPTQKVPTSSPASIVSPAGQKPFISPPSPPKLLPKLLTLDGSHDSVFLLPSSLIVDVNSNLSCGTT